LEIRCLAGVSGVSGSRSQANLINRTRNTYVENLGASGPRFSMSRKFNVGQIASSPRVFNFATRLAVAEGPGEFSRSSATRSGSRVLSIREFSSQRARVSDDSSRGRTLLLLGSFLMNGCARSRPVFLPRTALADWKLRFHAIAQRGAQPTRRGRPPRDERGSLRLPRHPHRGFARFRVFPSCHGHRRRARRNKRTSQRRNPHCGRRVAFPAANAASGRQTSSITLDCCTFDARSSLIS